MIYVSIRQYYSGEIRSFITMLLLFALFETVAAVFRYFGHGTEFGFTSDYSLRWLQSIAHIIAAVFFIIAGYNLLHLFGGNKE